jgi:hypothetical protein
LGGIPPPPQETRTATVLEPAAEDGRATLRLIFRKGSVNEIVIFHIALWRPGTSFATLLALAPPQGGELKLNI